MKKINLLRLLILSMYCNVMVTEQAKANVSNPYSFDLPDSGIPSS